VILLTVDASFLISGSNESYMCEVSIKSEINATVINDKKAWNPAFLSKSHQVMMALTSGSITRKFFNSYKLIVKLANDIISPNFSRKARKAAV